QNRWLLVEFVHVPTNAKSSSAKSEAQILPALDSKKIWTALKLNIIHHFGETGWGKVSTSLTVKYFSPTTRMAIIRVARDHHEIAWAGLTLLSSIDRDKFIPHVVHISG
ncbi:ribonuclease P/MRP protein subunit, partial [Auriculariales sp. MPI-PUGE-AT-0066]